MRPDQHGLYDFALLQDKRFSIITVRSDKIERVCAQFGAGALNGIVVDSVPVKPGKYDPFHFDYGYYPLLSNLHHNNQEIDALAWVGDRMYLKTGDNYVSVDIK